MPAIVELCIKVDDAGETCPALHRQADRGNIMRLRMICADKSLIDGPGYLAAGESYRVGRSSRCSFVLGDLSVSRFHAEMVVTQMNVHVRDLSSRNGTFVDGVRIDEMDVQPGQQLRFGSAHFHLVSEEEPGEPADISELSTHFVPAMRPSEPAGMQHLTEGPRRVLDLLLKGLQEKEVALRLRISQNTVHVHVREIYKRLGVSSRSELLALFIGESPQ
jgi:DNA-binding CsgD family transcriptional regulator